MLTMVLQIISNFSVHVSGAVSAGISLLFRPKTREIRNRLQSFNMEYNKFIQTSFNSIKKSRESILGYQIIPKMSRIPAQPQNIYVQLLAEKGKQSLKIQQWNFKSLKTLLESEYGSDDDSQLDSVEVHKKSFSQILEQKLAKFHPKTLVKALQPKKLTLTLITQQKQLTPFIEQDIYLINVDQYEATTFNCEVTLQTIHGQMHKKQRIKVLESSQQEFQVLQDSTFKSKRAKDVDQQVELPATKQKIKTEGKGPDTKSNDQKQSQKKEEAPQLSQAQPVYMCQYETTQINLSQYEQKILLASETIELIEQLNLGGSSLKSFLQKIQ